MPDTPVVWKNTIPVNTVTTGAQYDTKVVTLSNGNILLAWTSTADTGAGSAIGQDIIGQIYDPFGNPVGGEFRLNSNFFSDDELNVDIAVTATGFIIVYEDNDTADGQSVSIRLQEYDNTGALVSSSTTVVDDAATTDPNFRNATIAVSSATSALIVYEQVTGGQPGVSGRSTTRPPTPTACNSRS